MSTTLSFGRDAQGYNAFAAPFATDKYSATIASAGNATLTLPLNVKNWIVAFSFQPGSNIWVSLNGTAAAPAGSTFASTTSQLLPGSWIVYAKNDGTANTINFLNNGTASADIGVALYAVT